MPQKDNPASTEGTDSKELMRTAMLRLYERLQADGKVSNAKEFSLRVSGNERLINRVKTAGLVVSADMFYNAINAYQLNPAWPLNPADGIPFYADEIELAGSQELQETVLDLQRVAQLKDQRIIKLQEELLDKQARITQLLEEKLAVSQPNRQ